MNQEFVEKVLEYYPLEVKEIALVKSKSGRMMWEIETDKGTKVAKAVKMQRKRMIFLTEAHVHLYENGLPISPIQLTKNHAVSVGTGNIYCTIYDKADGDELNYYHIEQMEKVSKFMGQFYQASQGYQLSGEGKKRTRLDKWHKLYRWKLQELEGYKRIALSYEGDQFSQLFLQYVDKYLERGREALASLDTSCYKEWTKEVTEIGGFCQQDFTLARFVEIDGEPMMKELHSVTYDLPSRDVRILLNKITKKLSVWDNEVVLRLLRAYESSNPLTKEQYEVLWIDLAFPHLFCSIAHKYYLQQKQSWSDEKYLWALQNIISVEESKEEFLQNFSDLYGQIKEGVKDE